jgi:hypothetical protein
MTSKSWDKFENFLYKLIDDFGKNMLAVEGIYIDEYGKIYSRYLGGEMK